MLATRLLFATLLMLSGVFLLPSFVHATVINNINIENYNDYPGYADEGYGFVIDAEADWFTGWDWAGFIYSSTTSTEINKINFHARTYPFGTSTAEARWEVYKTFNPDEQGTLIAYSDYVTITETVGTTTVTNNTFTATFNTSFEIGGVYLYRFVLVPATTGETSQLYYTYNRSDVATTSTDIYVQTCTNEYPIDDCDTNWTQPTITGNYGVPVVELLLEGVTADEYVTTDAPCVTHSDTRPNNYCNVPQATSTSVSGFVNTVTANKKVTIYLKDKYYNTLDSVAFYYPTTTYSSFEQTFALQASSTYRIHTCLSDDEAFPDYGVDPVCTMIVFTTGDVPVDSEALWCELFPTDPTCTDDADTLWNQYECDDIGITDVKQGVICAGIFLFIPDLIAAKQNVSELKTELTTSFPFLYVTRPLYDLANHLLATTSTTTQFVISMNMEAFDLPSTDAEINITEASQHAKVLSPTLFESIDYFLYAFLIYYVVMRIISGTWAGASQAATMYGYDTANIIRDRRTKTYIGTVESSKGLRGYVSKSRRV